MPMNSLYSRILIVPIFSFFPKAMSATELAFTSAVAGLSFSTPCCWVAFGIVGVVSLFGTICFVAHEEGKTQRARIEKKSKSG